MKITTNFQQKTTPPISPSPLTKVSPNAPRLEDTFITSRRRIRVTWFTTCRKLLQFFANGWEWITFLFTSDKGEIKIIRDIVEDPNTSAMQFKENPDGFLLACILAILSNPKKANWYRKHNQIAIKYFVKECKGIGKYLRRFPHQVNYDITKLFISLSDLPSNPAFLSFISQHSTQVTIILQDYFKTVLDVIQGAKGDREKRGQTQLMALKIAFRYLLKITQTKGFPTVLPSFFRETFRQSAFSLQKIIETLAKHCPPYAQPTGKEWAAIALCTKDQNEALHRFHKRPEFLDTSLQDTHIGFLLMIQICICELTPEDFNQLTAILKENHPLAAGICHYCAKIAHHPGQLSTFSKNLPHALEVLENMRRDANHALET